ncbi:DNA-directed DNA polymerase gamma mip1 [Cladochytrium tenue]|nr:DNA-directed DNA polymerase gamma mip1 [Cladochytrium tenue]
MTHPEALRAQAASAPEFRQNEVGIQMLSRSLYSQLFPTLNPSRHAKPDHVDVADKLLTRYDLKGKQEEPVEPINLPLPPLVGDTIEEHFAVLGAEQAQEPFRLCEEFSASNLPLRPQKWSRRAGWSKYSADNPDADPVPVPFPDEDALAFDVETAYKLSPLPILAVAASPRAWYSWISPDFAPLLDEKLAEPAATQFRGGATLIPLGSPSAGGGRIVVGHNVSYDRARVLEEYNLSGTKNDWIDTMSLHFAVSGLSNQQRPDWIAQRKQQEKMQELEALDYNSVPTGGDGGLHDAVWKQERRLDNQALWADVSAMANLRDVVNLHLKRTISKEARGLLASTEPLELAANFDSIIDYCAGDVSVTKDLFSALFPKFVRKCPHPVTFAGMLKMGKGFLPTNGGWSEFIKSADGVFSENTKDIEDSLLQLARAALEMADGEKWRDDPWLCFLNWEPGAYRSKNPEVAGRPKWFRDLWSSPHKRIKLSLSSRVAPYLLKLQWRDCPVYYSKSYGWLFRVPEERQAEFRGEPVTLATDPTAANFDAQVQTFLENHVFFRIPHKDGDDVNCGNPLSKSYLKSFDAGHLTSSFPLAIEILRKSSMCAYWTSARERVTSQLVVPAQSPIEPFISFDGTPGSVILPSTVAMGTVTRRAVEPLWMTAANAKKGIIGTELKSKIVAPRGYAIVGADVDSEELWICSLLGDSALGIHGATPLGFMTLQGSKEKKTDLHSTTGAILGISRDAAKVFNYSRLYGAGQAHSVQLLLKSRPTLDRAEAVEVVSELLRRTRGYRSRRNAGTIWVGGSESHMFNMLEAIADKQPVTPVLSCTIPDALLPEFVGKKFATSRVNWVVQSSGVDYLHLLLVSMDYLMRRMGIHGRFALSIHDEIRFLVSEDQVELAAYALQISNLWTRALFATRLAIDDLPQNVAFFSSVDVDFCLRKEVDMECVTPSNPTPLAKGRRLKIEDVIAYLKTLPASPLGTEELPSVATIRGSTLAATRLPLNEIVEVAREDVKLAAAQAGFATKSRKQSATADAVTEASAESNATSYDTERLPSGGHRGKNTVDEYRPPPPANADSSTGRKVAQGTSPKLLPPHMQHDKSKRDVSSNRSGTFQAATVAKKLDTAPSLAEPIPN